MVEFQLPFWHDLDQEKIPSSFEIERIFFIFLIKLEHFVLDFVYVEFADPRNLQ